MLSVLTSFLDIIVSLVNFVINTINSFIVLIQTIPQFTSFATSTIELLPQDIIPFALASMSLSIILFILGR